MQIWGFQNPQTPQLIDVKFGMGDYIGNITRMPEFKRIASMGASWHMSKTLLSRGL